MTVPQASNPADLAVVMAPIHAIALSNRVPQVVMIATSRHMQLMWSRACRLTWPTARLIALTKPYLNVWWNVQCSGMWVCWETSCKFVTRVTRDLMVVWLAGRRDRADISCFVCYNEDQIITTDYPGANVLIFRWMFGRIFTCLHAKSIILH